MVGQRGTVTLRNQITGAPPYLFDRINALLKEPGLKRFRAMVAYARWDGVGLLATNIEAVLKAGVEFQAVYGVANGVTTPDCLLYSLYLQKLYKTHTFAGAIEDKYINATFHPKVLEFKFDDKVVAFIGSANLTGAGLSRNAETNIEVECKIGGDFEAQMETAWLSMRSDSKEIDLTLIRQLALNSHLGSEAQNNENRNSKAGKPAINTGAKASPKPLFAKVLDIQDNAKKTKLLTELDPVTTRPDILYLQILKGETGAQVGGGIGYQIQLPTATLATYFGVGPTQKRQASFKFGAEIITVSLTHFENNTHRVRLRPLRDVPRPAIVKFRRIGSNQYECSLVPLKNYKNILATKCTQQTRSGARRWGME